MRKELIITIIIVIFVIIGNCITQKYTKKCVSETTSQLEELKKNALDGEKDHNELAKMAFMNNGLRKTKAFLIILNMMNWKKFTHR